MTDERRWANRGRWPWWKRGGDFLYRLFLAPFMTKVEDGSVIGGMGRWAVFTFTVAEVLRLAPIWLHTPAGWVVTMVPLGWPDVAAIFFILYALAIDKALNNAQPKEVLSLVGKMLPGGGATQSVTAPDGTVMTQSAAQPPTIEPTPKAEL